ncbi:hypothetical protein JCM11641_001119 [Rhodosporidiobolus odoratus]
MTDSPTSEAPAEPSAPASRPPLGAPVPSSRPSYSPSASYLSSSPGGAPTPSSLGGYDSSMPSTPWERGTPPPPHPYPTSHLSVGALDLHNANHNAMNQSQSLALDTPARELGNLSLATTPEESNTPGGTAPNIVSGVGADSQRLTDHAGTKDHHQRLAEAVLARTSAGQQALKEGALPSAKGIAVPGPAAPPSSSSSAAGTGAAKEGASSTAVTPGTSRVGTPQLDAAATKNKDRLAPPPSTLSTSSHAQGRRPGLDGKTDGVSPKEGKKSVFGKLFDRDKNSSSVSVAISSAGMERGGNGSSGGAGSGHESTGGGSNGVMSWGGANASTPSLARRPSGSGAAGGKQRDKEEEKRVKEMEKREKQERKEREKREKEEAKQEASRARSASRGRTPSQTGRARSGSKGAEEGEKKGALDGAMDFMRIKVQRKTSVTSRKSDDGKSEKSVHLGGGEEGRSQYGGSEGAKSRGGQSNASLSKKYGVCDKVIVGKGATAVVRLAHKWDRSQEKLYAVKEFRKRRKNETEKEYVKKLTSEFCISSTLHHHNVVETVDLVQDEQQHWCEVMEYCPGGDLYAVIKKGDLGPPEINSYFKQIIAGVAYLHSMGVAHRDIKPENLLLDAKGHVKITDFGVSDVFRMCWEKTTHLSKGLCGSEPYIAPEQFEHKEYDARQVDIWATAVVYYCMTFSELPWRVAKSSDPSFGPYTQLYRSSSSTPPPLSNLVPRECRSIIRRMLDPDPKSRVTTEEIMRDPWFERIEVVPPLEGVGSVKPSLP